MMMRVVFVSDTDAPPIRLCSCLHLSFYFIFIWMPSFAFLFRSIKLSLTLILTASVSCSSFLKGCVVFNMCVVNGSKSKALYFPKCNIFYLL